MLLYYITDRRQFPGNETSQRQSLLQKIAEAARAGVDCIQLREKDLPGRELEQLAKEALQAIQKHSSPNTARSTKLFINSRTDIALATGCDGVHLPAGDLSALDVRNIWQHAPHKKTNVPIIAVSCHAIEEVKRAAQQQVEFIVFAPVFEKKNNPDASTTGLDTLHQACSQGIPTLALGGITLKNAHQCIHAGASGVAGIRLFQENNIAEIVRQLRS